MESDKKLAGLISKGWRKIPEDLWAAEILKRLPIKTLVRSRCVCKAWKCLSTSPLCIATHHSFTASSMPSNRQPFLLLGLRRPSYAIYHPHEFPTQHLTYLSDFPTQFWDSHWSKLVDVINGVVCVSYSLSSSFDSNLVWNPAIRRYVALPQLLPPVNKMKKRALEGRTVTSLPRKRKSHFQPNAIGFGYQSSKNDFKVVRVWIPCSSSSGAVYYKRPRYEVYSSQQGLWREAKTKTKAPFNRLKSCGFITPTGCFLNGTIHWILLTSNDVNQEDEPTGYAYPLLVLMFDCEREEFRTMELPEEVNDLSQPTKEWPELLKYSGMLSVLRMNELNCVGDLIELWAMKEHGVPTTWNKLFSIEMNSLCGFRPVVMTREDGHTFLLSLEELASFDPNRRGGYWDTSPIVNSSWYYQPLNGYVYEESMFLMGCKGAKSCPVEVEAAAETQLSNMWTCPPPLWIKLNIHVVFEGCTAGLGGVFRHRHGGFVRAFASKMIIIESALAAQLTCLLEGLKKAKMMGIRSLIVETDAIQLVQAMASSELIESGTESQTIWANCKDLIKGLDPVWEWRVAICHAPTKLNKVARWFAETVMKQDAEFLVFMKNDCPYEVKHFIESEECERSIKRYELYKEVNDYYKIAVDLHGKV